MDSISITASTSTPWVYPSTTCFVAALRSPDRQPREVILKQLKETAEPIEARVPDLPADVASLVKWMMQKDPKDRIPSASALLEKLNPLLDRYDEDMTTGAAAVRGVQWKRILMLVGVGFLLTVIGVLSALLIRQYNNALDDERVRHKANTEILDNVESSIGGNDLAAARAELDTLDSQQLDEDQTTRYQNLQRALEYAVEEAKKQRFEETALVAYNKLQSELTPPRGAEAIERLRAFATEFAGSEAAADASQQASELSELLQARAEHEEEAREKFESASRKAHPFLPDYARVRLELSKFDVTKYDTTTAYKSWEEAVRTLKERARNDWLDFSRKIADDRQSQRSVAAMISEVEAFLRRLGDFDDFDVTRQEATALLEELRKEL